jgi:murein DD-endopeptidase MepM/ murein hydrolase activator NlpD
MGKKNRKSKRKNNKKKATSNTSTSLSPQTNSVLPSGNYVQDACPGCHVIHDPAIPSWCLEAQSEPFVPEEFGLTKENEHLMPEISIEPDTGVVCLTNRSNKNRRSFFITFGHQLLGHNDVPLQTGIWRDEQGDTHLCTTLIVVLQPRRLLEVCRVVPERLDPHVSVWDATNSSSRSSTNSSGSSGSGGADNSKTDEITDGKENHQAVDLYSTISDVANIPNDSVSSSTSVLEASISTAKRRSNITPSIHFPLGGKGPYLCSQGACGCFTHFYSGTMHAIDLCCPVGTPVLAVEDGTIMEVKDETTVGGIHSAHLFQWNSIMLRVDKITASNANDENAVGSGETKDSASTTAPTTTSTTASTTSTISTPCYVEYVHIASGSATVKKGDIVKRGDIICSSGDIGFCPTPHLHIQVHNQMKKDAPTIPFLLKVDASTEKSYVPIAGVKYDPKAGPIL